MANQTPGAPTCGPAQYDRRQTSCGLLTHSPEVQLKIVKAGVCESFGDLNVTMTDTGRPKIEGAKSMLDGFMRLHQELDDISREALQFMGLCILTFNGPFELSPDELCPDFALTLGDMKRNLTVLEHHCLAYVNVCVTGPIAGSADRIMQVPGKVLAHYFVSLAAKQADWFPESLSGGARPSAVQSKCPIYDIMVELSAVTGEGDPSSRELDLPTSMEYLHHPGNRVSLRRGAANGITRFRARRAWLMHANGTGRTMHTW